MSTAELLAVGGHAFAKGLNNVPNQVTLQASSFQPPCTAAASASLVLDGTQAQPTLTLSMSQANPELLPSGAAMQCYATQPSDPANSFVCARPTVLSAPLETPVRALAGVLPGWAAHPQVAPVDEIELPSLSGGCKIMFWLCGGSAAAFAAGIAAPQIQTFSPGVGFKLEGTPGAVYGYAVLYA